MAKMKQTIDPALYQKRLEELHREMVHTRARDGIKVCIIERWRRTMAQLVKDGQELHRREIPEE